MHIRRCEDAAIIIQSSWRGMRWRLWLHSATMPFISSWHPSRSMFLNAERFESMRRDTDEHGDRGAHAKALRIELEDEVDTFRSLAKMATDHYGPERIDSSALIARTLDKAHSCEDDIHRQMLQLLNAMRALQQLPASNCAAAHCCPERTSSSALIARVIDSARSYDDIYEGMMQLFDTGSALQAHGRDELQTDFVRAIATLKAPIITHRPPTRNEGGRVWMKRNGDASLACRF